MVPISFLLVLLGVATMVDLAQGLVATTSESALCGPHGMMHSNRTCSCAGGWKGSKCTERVCPYGLAWAGPNAHEPAECSNAGICDQLTGLCTCTEGFEGAACDRVVCPSGDAGVCNGRGRCLSMAAAGREWDGRSLVVPDAAYESNWDAHKIQGCLCDEGFSGYDCSLRECPRGDDPLTTGQQNEILRLVCQADAGSFTIAFRGHTSNDIPYNAPYGLLKEILESMLSIAAVTVTLGGSGVAVCEAGQEVITTIEFTQDFGSLPVAKVESVDLSLSGGAAVLLLETLSELTCAACSACAGGIYMSFGAYETNMIAFGSTADAFEAELQSLASLSSSSIYGTLDSVSVVYSSGSSLCDSASSITSTILVRGAYGNLPDFGLVNSIYDSGALHSGVSLSSSKGTKENELCSNHGECDVTTGVCTCFTTVANGDAPWIRWDSSDGYGGVGGRPDCGHRTVSDASLVADDTFCLLDVSSESACSGNGVCNSTGGCDCYYGFHGGNCQLRDCPVGKAWFDEPSEENVAHSHSVECSGAGICDTSTGTCVCAAGREGAACERLTSTCLEGCSGHGRCLPMWRIAEEASSSAYGTSSSYVIPHAYNIFQDSPSSWDFDVIYSCHCDSPDGWGEGRASGPKEWISGKWQQNPRLPGWSGASCALRTCPRGDNPSTSDSADNEVQTIACTSTSGSFTLTFREETTAAIAYNAVASDVESALEDLTTISDVSVTLDGGTACDGSYEGVNSGMRVTFVGDHGDLPMMASSPVFTIVETTPGTKESVECSGKGECDTSTGLCTCWPGYASSDGEGNHGTRGDCSYYHGTWNIASDIL